MVRERDALVILAAVVHKVGGMVKLTDRDLVDAFGLTVECIDGARGGKVRSRLAWL